MRLLPILTAIIVAAVIFLFVFQRDLILPSGASQTEENASEQTTEDTDPNEEKLVSVVVIESASQDLTSQVLVRGQTQAARQVNLVAETSGAVISPPLRKGTFVKAGQSMCELDPGTRDTALAEAQARLAEARAQVPSAEARLLEARAQVPSAEARLAEAKAQVPSSEARLDEARAQVPSFQARLDEARSQVPSAEARLQEARARLEEAQINENAASKLKAGGFASQTRVAAASAALEAAQAGVKAAEAGIETALAGIRNAEAGIESAAAGVRNAEAGIESAKAGVRNAEAGISSAEANIKTAEAGIESTQAAIESAEAGVASAAKEIERLIIKASFDGILESDTAELGSVLQPGALCATVIQLDPIKLVGFVTEVDVNRVTLGKMAQARLLNGSEVQGRVSFLSRSADQTTRTFRVEIEVPNPDLTIRDGQSADIAIASAGTKAHLVPGSALTLNANGALGLRTVDDNDVVKFKPVTVLRDTIDGMWVDGLPEMAKIIVVGQEFVTEGVQVRTTMRGAAQ